LFELVSVTGTVLLLPSPPEVSGLAMLVSMRVVWLLFLRLLLGPWSRAGLLLECRATEALSLAPATLGTV